uniref:Endonuclease n=1 Tax=Vibrio phage Vc1 TaxID=1480731 RepID=A0A6M5C9Y6_9CAUD
MRYQFPTWITFHVNNEGKKSPRYQFPTWITFHVNNEGKKSPGQANKDQMKGLLKGVPDILIIPDRTQCKYGFIAIELKRAKKSLSKVSDDQKKFLSRVTENGGFAALCYGADRFKRQYKRH